MRLALRFAEHGVVEFEAWREYGYQAAILLLSLVVPRPTPSSLITWITALQVTAYIALFGLLVVLAGRWRGPWAAAAVAATFAIDRYNGGWMANVMSEAPSKLLALSGLTALLVSSHDGQRRWMAAAGALLLGLVPLFRSADLAVPAAAAVGVTVWLVLRPTLRRAFGGMSLIALLVGPTLLFSAVQEARTGFFGLSARGADHAAARFVILADPDKVLASGASPQLVEEIFRPIHKWWSPLAGRQGVMAPGSPEYYFPFTRDRALLAAGAPTLEGVVAQHLASTNQVVTHYTVAQFSASLVRTAFLADPVPILKSIAVISWDYMRIPFLWNYYGESRFQIYLWPLLWAAFWAYLWRNRMSVSAEAWGFSAAAAVLLPAYWISISVGSMYNPRYATHQHLTATMSLLIACLLIRRPSTVGGEISGFRA